jgi:pimeloyl-ACP methyl ester carboxylesterase
VQRFFRDVMFGIGLCLVLGDQSFAADSACVDRLASKEVPSAFDRLPNGSYRCLRLQSGVHVWVAEWGDAVRPAVILVHGMGHNAHRDWRATVPALLPHFRVVAFDLPGFGASEVAGGTYSLPALTEVVREIAQLAKAPRFHLIGHSLGASISLEFAARYPESVDRLVLVDVAGVLLRPVFIRHLAEDNVAAVGLDSLNLLLGGAGGISQLLDLLEEQSALLQMVLEAPSVRGALFGRAGFPDAAVALLDYDFTSAIQKVDRPTTIIWGEEDTVTPLRAGGLLADRMLNARLRIIEGAQHMPMNQRPDAFNRALLEALQGPDMLRVPAPIDPESQGDVRCENQTGVRYSGTFERLILESCSGVTIENARARRLIANRSSIAARNLHVISTDVALELSDSTLMLTNGIVGGRIAIVADNSRLDLAGVTLRGVERGVQTRRPSRIYFSVSEYSAPEFQGNAHFSWPPASVNASTQ